jgi:integrase
MPKTYYRGVNAGRGRAKRRSRRPKHGYGKVNALTPAQFLKVWELAGHTKAPLRDRALVGLSFGCGLRGCEIAGLRWHTNVLDADGKVAERIHITSDIAKMSIERFIYLTPEVREALVALHKARPNDPYVIYPLQPHRAGSKRAKQLGPHRCHPNTLVQYWKRLYRQVKIHHCASHTGRVTFATNAGRQCNLVGGSTRDVQDLLGHASLESTQRYMMEQDGAHRAALVRRILPF